MGNSDLLEVNAVTPNPGALVSAPPLNHHT
jgi:hypothetical protein